MLTNNLFEDNRITVSNQSLPNTVSAVRTTTYNHLAIHVKLHRLHPRFLLMSSQNQLLLTCSVVKQVNKSIICSYCKQTARSIHTYTVSWFLLCTKTISLSTSCKIPSFDNTCSITTSYSITFLAKLTTCYGSLMSVKCLNT
jgi:hypothetical protein